MPGPLLAIGAGMAAAGMLGSLFGPKKGHYNVTPQNYYGGSPDAAAQEQGQFNNLGQGYANQFNNATNVGGQNSFNARQGVAGGAADQMLARANQGFAGSPEAQVAAAQSQQAQNAIASQAASNRGPLSNAGKFANAQAMAQQGVASDATRQHAMAADGRLQAAFGANQALANQAGQMGLGMAQGASNAQLGYMRAGQHGQDANLTAAMDFARRQDAQRAAESGAPTASDKLMGAGMGIAGAGLTSDENAKMGFKQEGPKLHSPGDLKENVVDESPAFKQAALNEQGRLAGEGLMRMQRQQNLAANQSNLAMEGMRIRQTPTDAAPQPLPYGQNPESEDDVIGRLLGKTGAANNTAQFGNQVRAGVSPYAPNAGLFNVNLPPEAGGVGEDTSQTAAFREAQSQEGIPAQRDTKAVSGALPDTAGDRDRAIGGELMKAGAGMFQSQAPTLNLGPTPTIVPSDRRIKTAISGPKLHSPDDLKKEIKEEKPKSSAQLKSEIDALFAPYMGGAIPAPKPAAAPSTAAGPKSSAQMKSEIDSLFAPYQHLASNKPAGNPQLRSALGDDYADNVTDESGRLIYKKGKPHYFKQENNNIPLNTHTTQEIDIVGDAPPPKEEDPVQVRDDGRIANRPGNPYHVDKEWEIKNALRLLDELDKDPYIRGGMFRRSPYEIPTEDGRSGGSYIQTANPNTGALEPTFVDGASMATNQGLESPTNIVRPNTPQQMAQAQAAASNAGRKVMALTSDTAAKEEKIREEGKAEGMAQIAKFALSPFSAVMPKSKPAHAIHPQPPGQFVPLADPQTGQLVYKQVPGASYDPLPTSTPVTEGQAIVKSPEEHAANKQLGQEALERTKRAVMLTPWVYRE